MDIVFVNTNSFPEKYRGNSIITLHGSWNRPIPVGYSAVHLINDKKTGLPTSVENFLWNNGTSARWPQSIRPVGLGWAKCSYGDCLYIGSDSSGQIIEMSYRGQN